MMALLYVAFTLCDFFNGEVWLSSWLKYCSIVGCFLYCFLSAGYHSLVTKGLFFTIIADVFLLFTEYYFFGVLSFCIVQLIYYYRIKQWNSNITNKHLILRMVFAIIVILLISGQVPLDWVLGITVFYFMNFVANLVLLSKTYHIMRHNLEFRRFFLGMGLFFMCDICVGLSNLSSYVTFSGSWVQKFFVFASFGMWGFYLPGQVLIALSCREKAKH
jgi:hypothetical protein